MIMIMLKDGLIPSGTVEEIACWRLWRHDCDVIQSRDVMDDVTIRRPL